MSVLGWFRVTTDGNGKVVSCVAVPHAEDPVARVFFVQARDVRHAGRLAFNRYMLAITKERHALYESQGKCRCGRPQDRPGYKRCTVCSEAGAIYNRRSRALRDGSEARPKLERREVIASRKDEEREAIRLETLRSVQRRYLAGSKDDFVRWLQREIETLAGKKVA